MNVSFEELLPFFGVSGSCNLIEGTPPGAAPSNIIRTNQSWSVKFDWTTSGPLNYLMNGKWIMKVYLEKMGAGEVDLPASLSSKTAAFVSAPNSYSNTITVPAGNVPEGLYKIAVSLTMVGPTGTPGPIAGFAEGELVQFYDGGPIS
jgi:hypothetical protein